MAVFFIMRVNNMINITSIKEKKLLITDREQALISWKHILNHILEYPKLRSHHLDCKKIDNYLSKPELDTINIQDLLYMLKNDYWNFSDLKVYEVVKFISRKFPDGVIIREV